MYTVKTTFSFSKLMNISKVTVEVQFSLCLNSWALCHEDMQQEVTCQETAIFVYFCHTFDLLHLRVTNWKIIWQNPMNSDLYCLHYVLFGRFRTCRTRSKRKITRKNLKTEIFTQFLSDVSNAINIQIMVLWMVPCIFNSGDEGRKFLPKRRCLSRNLMT